MQVKYATLPHVLLHIVQSHDGDTSHGSVDGSFQGASGEADGSGTANHQCTDGWANVTLSEAVTALSGRSAWRSATGLKAPPDSSMLVVVQTSDQVCIQMTM